MVVAIQKFDQMIYLTHFTIVIDIGTTVIPLFLLLERGINYTNMSSSNNNNNNKWKVLLHTLEFPKKKLQCVTEIHVLGHTVVHRQRLV